MIENYFGANLKKIREEKGMSRNELAKKAGCAKTLIYIVEEISVKEVDIFTADKIACALEVSVDYLLKKGDL